MVFDDWNRHNYLHQGDKFEVLSHSISAQIELQKRGKKLALLYMKKLLFFCGRNAYSYVPYILLYISQELNFTICFMSRNLDNHQETKLRICALVVFSAGGRKQNK